MLAEAETRGLDALVVIRTESELRRATDAGATIIGVNNRNLETLEIDPGTVDRILPMIPSSCIAVAESGMSTVADIERAAAAGADAVLVGSSLSSANDPASLIREFRSVTRAGRRA
jgi:indole-3-glycerol phosphate synthase